MGLTFDYSDGQTPLEEDEKEGLLIPTITTRQELDEFEQQNIERAVSWSVGRSIRVSNILTEAFIRRVHHKMYGDVWSWAGDFRKRNKNIGVDKWQIPVALRQLLDDTKTWIGDKVYPPDEIAVRFKHQIVRIHCFANGNGRHSRLMADILIQHLFKRPVFTWGMHRESTRNETRAAYLKAIRLADTGHIQTLVGFARS